MEPASEIRKIAFLGDYLPRKCGIATFTCDVLPAGAGEHPESHCFAVSVNDLPGGYEYPGVVRFETEEQDLPSYQRAAEFLNRQAWGEHPIAPRVLSAYCRFVTSLTHLPECRLEATNATASCAWSFAVSVRPGQREEWYRA